MKMFLFYRELNLIFFCQTFNDINDSFCSFFFLNQKEKNEVISRIFVCCPLSEYNLETLSEALNALCTFEWEPNVKMKSIVIQTFEQIK